MTEPRKDPLLADTELVPPPPLWPWAQQAMERGFPPRLVAAVLQVEIVVEATQHALRMARRGELEWSRMRPGMILLVEGAINLLALEAERAAQQIAEPTKVTRAPRSRDAGVAARRTKRARRG